MVEIIQKTDSLNDGRKKLNNAITAFNVTVVEGDSSVEAAQARVSKDNITYITLKDRLDTEQESLEQEIVELNNEIVELRNKPSIVVSESEPGDAEIWFEVE